MTDRTVDAFLDAVGTAFRNAGQIVPWPIHVARIAPYYSDLEAADLVRRMKDFRADGLDAAGLAALYPSASSAKSLMLDLVAGMKDANVPVPDRLDFVGTIFEGLARREHGDVFCRDGSHRILSGAEAAAVAAGSPWADARSGPGRDLASAAFTLSGAAQSLVWSIHFYGWTDISFVIHGPYRVTGPDGTVLALIVRDFFDISAAELWPEMPAVPCRTLQIRTLHDDTDAFTVDIFNHLLHQKAPLASTRWVGLSIDGSPCDQMADIGSLSRAIVASVRRQKGAIDGLGERELAAKFVESRYYAFRRWRSPGGGDWRPPPEVYRRLRQVALPPDPAEDPPWHVLREIFDPRLDWPEEAVTGAGVS